MLMITEQLNSDVLIFKLAGALAGDWALEFQRCWMTAADSAGAAKIIVDLSNVTFVDQVGRKLLSLAMKQGTELLASDILIKSIVEEIAKESSVA
jgi:anti-anti-sigma regulatory factor